MGILSYVKKHTGPIFLCVILVVIQSLCDLLLPYIMSEIIDIGIAEGNMSYIYNKGIDMLLVTFSGIIAAVVANFIFSKFACGVAKDLRNDIFKKVCRISKEQIEGFSISSLITRTTKDVSDIENFIVSELMSLLYGPIVAIGGFFMAISVNAQLSSIMFLSIVVLEIVIFIVFLVVKPKISDLFKLEDKLNLEVRENLTGIMVIRAFTNEKFQEKKLSKVGKMILKVDQFINRTTGVVMPCVIFVLDVAILLILWIGGHAVEKSSMQIGSVIAFTQYFVQIIFAFVSISMTLVMLPRAAIAKKRIFDVINIVPEIKDCERPLKLNDKKQMTIKFENVSFAYDKAEENLIEDVSFTAKPCKVTAIIGSTGSGKSSLVKLIPRIFDVTRGKITLNGVNIKDISQKDLRDLVAYVPQDGTLFSGTIASNLRYGNESADFHAMKRAAEIAEAFDFISQKKDNFDFRVSQDGKSLSGGQRQRVAIARAILKNAPIYIFDDCFSALDLETDAKVRANLREVMEECTVIIVAQRIGTIMDADTIVVLEDGKIVGVGKHNELLKSCKEYIDIAKTQLSESELRCIAQ